MFKPNFRFGRMHVHINVFVRNRHKHNHDRERTGRQNITVRFTDRVQNNLVSHKATVDKEKHRIPVVLLNVRPRCEEMNFHAGPPKCLFVLDELIQKVLAKHLENAFAESVSRGCGQDFKAGAFQQKVNLGKRKSIVSAVGCNLT
jgi:hypothetical protein